MCKCKKKCNCNITQITKGEKGDPSSQASLGYKIYVAMLSQTDTDAPVARVLANTMIGTLTWSRTGLGNYVLTSTEDEFTEDKTWVSLTVDTTTLIQGYWNTENNVSVDTQLEDGTASDGRMLDTSIEIRVYN